MKQMTYVGPKNLLKGKTALVRPSEQNTMVFAQFDDIENLPLKFTHGWQPYPAEFFREIHCEPADVEV